MDFYQEIIGIAKKKKLSKQKFSNIKTKLCKKYKMKKIPTDIDILLHADKDDIPKLKHLMTKPTRTISGVAIVAVMCKPRKCPHGQCIMCPSYVEQKVPQSYTGKEPATIRAIRNKFDSYLQVMNRLEQYVVLGHNPEKVELIIMGGTFPSYPRNYQNTFVTYIYKAMNDFSRLFYVKNKFDIQKFKQFFELPGSVNDPVREKSIRKKLLALKGKSSLSREQSKNQTSNIRCVGLTIESRPDYALLKHANHMLDLGCTRVELGVQSVYDKVLEKIERGHSNLETMLSIRILKDLGFKINAHYMPGLPGVNKKTDLSGMIYLFANPNYRPDMLKLYPCMVIPGTKLEKLYKKGKFKPLTTKKAAELIVEFKEYIPKYVRVMRVQRDIPTYMTTAGVDKTNLRQYVDQLMKKKKVRCQCIRCREVGRATGKIGKVSIHQMHYEASHGSEFFISAESKKYILGFCRLRFPSQWILRKELNDSCGIIRELHVYGKAVGLGKTGKIQHTGLGKELLNIAEDTARSYHRKKMVIISGVGVREYYKKFGYKKQGPYMVKNL